MPTTVQEQDRVKLYVVMSKILVVNVHGGKIEEIANALHSFPDTNMIVVDGVDEKGDAISISILEKIYGEEKFRERWRVHNHREGENFKVVYSANHHQFRPGDFYSLPA